MARQPIRRALFFTALTAVYFLAGRLGLSFAEVHLSASAVWPPTGLAFGALLLYGQRVWPCIFVGAFLVNLTTTGAIWVSLGIAAGNTLEGLAGAWLVNRFANGAACFERAGTIFRFTALAALASTTISATIGIGSLYLGDAAAATALGTIWMTWWLGDAVGALVVTPLLLLWLAPPRSSWPRERIAEAVLMFVVLALASVLVFVAVNQPLAFLTLPPLAWAAFRFGPREVATALAVQAVIATYGTLMGHGPFHPSLLTLQAFMGTVALTMLPIAALVGERREALRQADHASRAKDEFIATLSHELRNPLQAISNAAELLPAASGAAAPAVDIIRRQTGHITRLINDLLDVARVVAGKVHLVRRPVDLAQAARGCLTMLQAGGQTQQHAVHLRAVPVWVHADPERLAQAITNLLTNALKYTPAGGRVAITVRADDGKAVLEVADTGIGMPADLLPHVFEPFTQGHHGTDRGAGGLGIGLTLVRRLAELHGGTVTAHSAGEGRGSRFVLRLPAITAPAQPADDDAAPAVAPARGLRVLVIEDNADARDTLRALLETLGHSVKIANDGEEGLAAALRETPDVALIDVGLPGRDGYDVARTLRAQRPGVHLCAVTGYGTAEDRQRALAAGFDEHLVKPVRVDDLHKVLAATGTGGAGRAAVNS